MSRSRIFGLSAIAVLILSTGYFVGFASYVPIQRVRSRHLSAQRKETEETRLAQYTNKMAPPIISETLGGEKWHLANQRGKVVLVFFWSILCDDCVKAIPAMNGIHSTYGKREDFSVVGVHRFPQKDVISSYCSAKGISWPQLYEDSESSQAGFLNTLGMTRTPSICIIDKEGKVKAIHAGLGSVEEEVRGLLESNAAN